jgi:hypothetical protein
MQEKPAKRPVQISVGIRLTRKQKHTIEADASRAGLTRSEFCRRKIFDGKTTFIEHDPELTKQISSLNFELNRQGQNLWQAIGCLRDILVKCESADTASIESALQDLRATEAQRTRALNGLLDFFETVRRG